MDSKLDEMKSSIHNKRPIEDQCDGKNKELKVAEKKMEQSPVVMESYDEWLESNLDGFFVEENYRMKVPRNKERVPALFDQGFSRFQPLIEIGKKKFRGNILNTATTKEKLISHAKIITPHFLNFIDEFLGQNPGAQSTQAHLVKCDEGLDFRLRWKEPAKLHDMLRTTIFCPTITSLRQTFDKFIAFCQEIQKDIEIVNFFDNVVKFGDTDRVSVTNPFGYVGVHVCIPFTVEISSTSPPPTPSEGCAEESRVAAVEQITMVAEVQFHPTAVFDGSPSCPKEKCHPVYRGFGNGEITALAAKDIEAVKDIRVGFEALFAFALATTPL